MTAPLGTEANPLRVAIIGSGPSAFYAAEHLQKQTHLVIHIDMFERLPTPFGLVRGGVAPDHPRIKSVTAVYDRIAAHPHFRFYGNVEFGRDLTQADLAAHYHQIIYATGAQTDRKMGIPGEDLPGSHPATEFVGWYNGHPDYRHLKFDLSQTSAAVIGNGNVAMDVARILARTYEELRATGIADYALEALRHSRVREIYVLGRRGPVQAAFTNPELKELGELADADVIVAPEEVELDPLSREWLMTRDDRNAERNVQTLMRYASTGDTGKTRKIYMRFLVSPTQIFGRERVEGLRIVKNELYRREDGTLRPRQTGVFETLPVGLVFRSIGYQAVPLPDVPFDHFASVIPNERGRVVSLDRQALPGLYVVGWIKRGPTGIIGTNKPDAMETVTQMMEDVAAGRTLTPESPLREAMERLLAERNPNYVTYEDWLVLDKIERQRGEEAGRPRAKFTRVGDMLKALETYRGVRREVGTEANPLRVAIIGSGPSAFYAAEHLQKQTHLVIHIDMFERLPTPFGLVRGGVAPDHPRIKSVTAVYDRIAAHPHFRFYGNVEFGRDLTQADLAAHYHQIIYATGAQTDRKMGIPGEDLPGSHPATEFVGWYNGHPDYRHLKFDLSQTSAAVIGNGNVAMDVARILARTYEELRATGIADYALEALRHSRVREIYVLGRRGPVQAAFTNPELKELGELADADVIVTPEEVELDPLSHRWLMTHDDRTAEQNVQMLAHYAEQTEFTKSKRIYMRFLVSPVEIIGKERVEAVRLVKNELFERDDGSLRPRPTNVYETLPAGLIFRSIGYRGVPLPGVPFDERAGVIPNDHGRVIEPESGTPVVGEYVVGWIKRGPTGIIGTNKPDAMETVNRMLEDVASGNLLAPASPRREAMERLLAERQPDYLTYEDWLILDRLERQRGEEAGRPRVKFTRVEEMLRALARYKEMPVPDAAR